MSDKQVDPDQLTKEATQLLADVKTLLMSTVSSDGIPEASYAPFVRKDNNCFYIYVSQLSRHTSNLDATGVASVLFIQNEHEASQPFARKRLTFNCRAERVARESDKWNEVMDAFADTFGEVMTLIRPLGDFKLFRLKPDGGTFVRGFGKAYRFVGALPQNFDHIKV